MDEIIEIKPKEPLHAQVPPGFVLQLKANSKSDLPIAARRVLQGYTTRLGAVIGKRA